MVSLDTYLLVLSLETVMLEWWKNNDTNKIVIILLKDKYNKTNKLTLTLREINSIRIYSKYSRKVKLVLLACAPLFMLE